MSPTDDPFFIGWAPTPPSLRGFVRAVAVALVGVGLGIGAALATAQEPLEVAVFEFGQLTTVRGTVRATTPPLLEVPRADGSVGTWLLVGLGKSGADRAVAPLDGQLVDATGTLIYRAGQTMLELVEDGLAPVGLSPQPPPALLPEGPVELVGEIVDSKCYLGVMNPGRKKTHRACAVRCISGGVPPVLLVEDERGARATVLLVGADGAPIHQDVLPFVAEPVRITGELQRLGDRSLLWADPASITRL